MASTILISGGASGIGRKIAETFLADGAKVHVCDSSPAMVTEFTDGVSGPIAHVEDIDPDDWDHCIAVDLNGTFYMTRRAVPLLRSAGGGSIVNIASTAGLFGVPLRSPYAASKWGKIGLTKTWAMELGPDNIRVNAVCPGCVSGPRIEAVIEKDAKKRNLPAQEVRDVYLRQSSMRTFVSAEEIAEAVLFLTSDAAARISGQALAIDGHTETLSNWLD